MLVLLIFLSTFAYAPIPLSVCEDLQNGALKYRSDGANFVEIFKEKRKLSTRLKYVLLWTRKDSAPFPQFTDGRNTFIDRKCPQVNCYVTNDRNFFGGGLERFHAIAFYGVQLNEKDLPTKRYGHQKYIYVNIESAPNHPVCNRVYDNYFNWTYTYKLNSDLLFTYFKTRYKNGRVVGPKHNMNWIKTEIDDKTLNVLKIKWRQKSRAVAWMVSHCNTLNHRENLVLSIKKSLHRANLSLTIYGKCGRRTCPTEKGLLCWEIMGRVYYFYLAFENSHADDYVTEKALRPLQYYMIPIVYGGANYSRFLAPGSYIDASKFSPEALVAKMTKIMSSLAEYLQYFKWKSVYKYTYSGASNVCPLCSALHNRTMMEIRKSNKQLRKWWLPNYKKVHKADQALHYLSFSNQFRLNIKDIEFRFKYKKFTDM